MAALLEKIRPAVAAAIVAAVALFYLALTVGRNPAWRNDFTLALNDVRTSSDSTKATMIAGGVLWEVAQAIDPSGPLPDDERIAWYLRRSGGSSVPAEVKQRMLADADRHLRRSIELYDRHFWAWNLLGNVRMERGEYAEAIAAWERVMQMRPDFRHLLVNVRRAGLLLADRKMQEGDVDGAVKILEERTRRDPSDVAALDNLGQLYLQRNDPVAAISAYERARASASRDISILTGLAEAYRQGGRSDDALATLRTAHEIEPSAELLEKIRAVAERPADRGGAMPRP
jgi:tetratricopeptide (TPR) repeat protein